MIYKNGSTLDKGRSTPQSARMSPETWQSGYARSGMISGRWDAFWQKTVTKRAADETWGKSQDTVAQAVAEVTIKEPKQRLLFSLFPVNMLTYVSNLTSNMFTYVSNLTSNLSGFSVSNLKFNLIFNLFFPFVAFSQIPCLIHQPHFVILNFWLTSHIQIYQTYSVFFLIFNQIYCVIL